MAFRLFIARGNSVGQHFIAVQPMVFVGSSPGCDVVLSDPGVSGRHLRISERSGKFFAEDLKSANGTLLNGAPMAHESEISTGDSLGIGTAVVQLTVLEVPDATEGSGRKKLIPTGVATSAKRQTGEEPVAKLSATAQDEPTLPVGKPLAKIDLPAPVPRSKRYEADTDKTSPFATAVDEPLPPRLDLPAPPIPPPPRSISLSGVKPLDAQAMPTHLAKAVAHELPTAQAQALFPVPDRERETGKVDPVGLRETAQAVPVVAPPPASWSPPRSTSGAAPAEVIDDKATAMVPPLPAAAEPMTEMAAPVVAAEPTRITAAPSPLAAPATASVLVKADELLRRTPDAAFTPTRVREPTVNDEATDPSGAARPDLPAPESAADRMRRRRQVGSPGTELEFAL